MATSDKLQDYLRQILTLEVTTVVVDRIPDHVTLDLKTQLRILGNQWTEDEDEAPRPARAGKRKALSSGKDDKASLRDEKSSSRDEKSSLRDDARDVPTLKKLFGSIARRVPGAVPARAANPVDAADDVVPEAVLDAGDALRSLPASLKALEHKAKQALQRERGKLIEQLLPNDDDLDAMPEKDRLALRRLATLGDQMIAAHTTLSVTGDLVNLLAADIAEPRYAPIRQMHAEGVTNAIGWWSAVAGFVRDVLGSLLDLISSGSRKG